MIGTEHEFSINDRDFNPLPVSDRIIRAICGRYESEILFGSAKLGKELQKTVLEVVPRSPADEIGTLENQLVQGIDRFHHIFRDEYTLLGLGMHPFARPAEIPVWDHDEGEYYEVYDRLFNIRQHGWLNIQALQINLSYGSERNLISRYNRIRSLLPYLIAVTASSPMVEGKFTGSCDNRLLFYRKNQQEIPLICNRIIPEKIRAVADYRAMQDEIFRELRARGAGILCEEWVNSSGLIIRFSRKCLEIKALDEQESVRSGMAVAAFVHALLRCRSLPVETDQDILLDLTEEVIRSGTGALRPELEALVKRTCTHATPDERRYLPVIEERIRAGSLSEMMRERARQDESVLPFLRDCSFCLRSNMSYPARGVPAPQYI